MYLKRGLAASKQMALYSTAAVACTSCDYLSIVLVNSPAMMYVSRFND